MSAIDVDQLLFEEKPLYVPALSEVVNGKWIFFWYFFKVNLT